MPSSPTPWPAVREVFADTASREDPADRVRTLCGGTPKATRARQTGELRLPGLHLHLRQDPAGQIPDQEEDPAGAHAGEAQDDQRGDVEAHAPADPRSREMAGAGRARLLQLSCRADQCACTGRVPAPCHRPLATHAAASQPKGSADVGTDDATGCRLASETDRPPSLAKRSLCRHTPEVGAVCGKAARTVLGGGRAMKRASLPLQRRAFITLLGGAAAAWSYVAGAGLAGDGRWKSSPFRHTRSTPRPWSK